MLRPPLVRVVQVGAGALFVFTVTFGMALGTSHTAGPLAFSSDGRMLLGTVNGYVWPMPNNPFFMYGVIKIWDPGTRGLLVSVLFSPERIIGVGEDYWCRFFFHRKKNRHQ